MWTKYHNAYLTGGCWSRTRPGVSFTIKDDGTLDVWDYLFKTTDPALTLQVSDLPLQSLRVEDSGKYVAAGDRDGSVTILELSDGLSVAQRNEKQYVSAVGGGHPRLIIIIMDIASYPHCCSLTTAV